jgi:hypothetical protein
MLVGVEQEFPAHLCQRVFLRILLARRKWSEAHASEHKRDFTYVGLTVTAIHPQGMQFKQFSGKVFVAAASSIADVVQVDEHRRVSQHAEEHVAEAAANV